MVIKLRQAEVKVKLMLKAKNVMVTAKSLLFHRLISPVLSTEVQFLEQWEFIQLNFY